MNRELLLNQCRDRKQSYCLYHCGHYRSIPLIIASETSLPAFRLIGNYATALQVWDRYDTLLDSCNNFTIRVTPAFQFDVLCSYERLTYHERYIRIKRVLLAMRQYYDIDEPNRLNELITNSRHKNSENQPCVQLQKYNWNLLDSLLPEDLDVQPECAYRLNPDEMTLPEDTSINSDDDDLHSIELLTPEAERAAYRRARLDSNKKNTRSIESICFPHELKKSDQKYMVLSLITDPEHLQEPIVIFFRSFRQNDSQLNDYVEILSNHLKPLEIFVVDMYTWGPLIGFDEVKTDADIDYESNALKNGQRIIVASNEEELEQRINEQFDTNQIPVIHLNEFLNENEDHLQKRIFNVIKD